MKTNFKSLALAALVLLGMGACSNELDEQLQQTEGQALTFNFSINNGATTKTITNSENRVTSWANGDEVGLFVYEKDAEVGTEAAVQANVKLTFDGQKWTSATPIYAGADYDFYAYYPYQAAVSNPTQISLTAQANQSQEADYGLSDVLAAPKTTVTAAATQLDMTFKHMFSLVEVRVSGDLVTAAPANVVLKNVKTAATLNLVSNEATVSGEAGDVIPQTLEAKENVYAYRAVVPAQTVAKEIQLVQLQNGEKHYAFKYSTDVAYEAGKYRTLNVLINEAKVELTIPTPGITPWEPSEPGSGQGGTEEIVPPAPKPETLVTDFGLSNATVFTAKGKFATNNYVSEGAGWFTRFADTSGKTTAESIAATFTTSTEISHALKLILDANATNGWNNNSVCYRIDKPFEQAKYKITFVAKPTVDGTSTTGGVMIRTAGDDYLFTIPFVDKEEPKEKGINTFTISTEKEVTATFDFTRKTTKANASAVSSTEIVESVADDVKGISIYFYNNTKGGFLEILPVKLEKVEEKQ